MFRGIRTTLVFCCALLGACADEEPGRDTGKDPSQEERDADAKKVDASKPAPSKNDGGKGDVGGSRDAGPLDAAMGGSKADASRDAGVLDGSEDDADAPDVSLDGASGGDGSATLSDAGHLIPKWGVSSSSCKLPKDCVDVATVAATTRACCTDTFECGMRLVSPEALRDSVFTALEVTPPPGVQPSELCLDNAFMFASLPPQPENTRVMAPGGKEVLISKECNSSSMAGFVYPGCCQPSGRCGLSTYTVNDTLEVLVSNQSHPFNQVECVTADELNAQLRASRLAGWGHVKGNDAPCDYENSYKNTPPAEL